MFEIYLKPGEEIQFKEFATRYYNHSPSLEEMMILERVARLDNKIKISWTDPLTVSRPKRKKFLGIF